MGGQNCHIEIIFEDEVKWLARLRLSTVKSPPLEIRNYILRSEVATLRYLSSQTSVPVPQIYDWCCEGDEQNHIGPGYVLMEKLEGKPLDWQALTTTQKDIVMGQLADISLEIEEHPFDSLGSLVETGTDSTRFSIGGIAHHTTFQTIQASCKPLGPFTLSRDAAQSTVEAYLDMIDSGEIATDCTSDVSFAHKFRLDILDDLYPAHVTNEKFYLKHPDDKGDHILVNENLDIVGIIDWEWAQTVSKKEAFSSPCMMWPVKEYYDGSNELSADELRFAQIFDERSRPDIGSFVTEGRKVQRFGTALGPVGGSHEDVQVYRDLFAGLRRAFGYKEDPPTYEKLVELSKRC